MWGGTAPGFANLQFNDTITGPRFFHLCTLPSFRFPFLPPWLKNSCHHISTPSGERDVVFIFNHVLLIMCVLIFYSTFQVVEIFYQVNSAYIFHLYKSTHYRVFYQNNYWWIVNFWQCLHSSGTNTNNVLSAFPL